MEYNETPMNAEVKTEKVKFNPDDKRFGLFGRLLETGKKFIKDDIKDEDYLK